MNVSIKWLSEYLGKPIGISKESLEDYSDKMTFSGSKVEGFELLHAELENIVAGRILSVEKHPGADKLSVCMLDVGEGAPVQIVTGAANVKAGDIVPVALDGSVICGGKRISRGEIRGVESQGMLCSLEELGLAPGDFAYADEDGILVLEGGDLDGVKTGQDIKSALMLDDAAVEFEITPNRPDCNSIIGLARESAATLGCGLVLSKPEVRREDAGDDIKNYLSVEVRDYALCPRYSARVVKDVRIAQSPLWLRAKLRACGVRPINNIVDITNYIMLEYGQPMHAFDYNYLSGSKIIVRTADNGEGIRTLDEQGRELDGRMLVIADGSKPVALAGVMGGENSEIKDSTRMIVFESANFEKMSVRRTSRRLGLRTDSSSRFEKGLDPHLTVQALERACELVELLECGTVVAGMIDEYKSLPGRVKLELEPEKINKLLGTGLTRGAMAEILAGLDFRLDGDTVEAPSYRTGDIQPHYADLAEEISRIAGYNELKPSSKIERGGRNKYQKFMLKLHECLLAGGFYETYTYSFIPPEHFDKLNLAEGSKLRDYIGLINPIGEEMSAMRTNLLSSTLATLGMNFAHRNERVYIYDFAKAYFKRDAGFKKGAYAADENNMLSVGLYDKEADFYTLKGAVGHLLETAGVKYKLSADISGHELAPAYHPGRSALISGGGRIYGIFGEVHPAVLENFGISARAYAAEINIDMLFADSSEDKIYKALPKYPATTRDLALVCDDGIESGVIYDIIAEAAGSMFESAEVFDVYKGDKIGGGKKSVAFAISFRDAGRTLSDDEVNAVIADILAELGKIGVELRR